MNKNKQKRPGLAHFFKKDERDRAWPYFRKDSDRDLKPEPTGCETVLMTARVV